jgi:hypothetical protein
MVTFDGYPLRSVIDLAVQESRVIIDRVIPSATVGHRTDETAGGRIITVAGEIRDGADVNALRLEELRRRVDDVARALDLEDGSATINAKLGTIEATWTAEDRLDVVAYTATFYETS